MRLSWNKSKTSRRVFLFKSFVKGVLRRLGCTWTMLEIWDSKKSQIWISSESGWWRFWYKETKKSTFTSIGCSKRWRNKYPKRSTFKTIKINLKSHLSKVQAVRKISLLKKINMPVRDRLSLMKTRSKICKRPVLMPIMIKFSPKNEDKALYLSRSKLNKIN